jgi:hypothetical protein
MAVGGILFIMLKPPWRVLLCYTSKRRWLSVGRSFVAGKAVTRSRERPCGHGVLRGQRGAAYADVAAGGG